MSPTRRHRRHARQPSPQRQERRAQRAIEGAHIIIDEPFDPRQWSAALERAERAVSTLPAGKVPLGNVPEVVELLGLHADVVRR